MTRFPKAALAGALLLAVAAGGCSDEIVVTPDFDRVYNQVERLGNPLVSEVMIAKRNHAFHNVGRPGSDVANHQTELVAFTSSFGRPASLAQAIAGVLLPDMLIVQTNRAGNTAGWLTWALADGYGGRRLTDDVVDAGLAAILGTLLDTTAALPASYRSDNVGTNNKPFLTSFPYLATAN